MLFAQPSTTCKSVLEPLPCKKFGSLTGSNFPCAAWPAILGIKHTLVSPSQLCIPMGRSKYTEGSASSLDAPFASSCVLLLRVFKDRLCVLTWMLFVFALSMSGLFKTNPPCTNGSQRRALQCNPGSNGCTLVIRIKSPMNAGSLCTSGAEVAARMLSPAG